MFGNISIWQLLILLLIVVLVFGTKRLRSLGTDLGGAIRGFRKGMEEDDDKADSAEKLESAEEHKPTVEQQSETTKES